MKDIKQEEFEQRIRDILEGKCTRADLIKELKIDRITLNNEIQRLYVYNQELYFQFIAKFPYKPREYTHIDYEAMLIDIMKKGYTKKEAAEQYGIHDRTITRKAHQVGKEKPELENLYREVSYYRKHKYKLPQELQEKVNCLEEKEVFIGGIYDKREEELLKKERQYNQTKLEGTSDVKAYGSKRTMKDLSTLYRLEIEQNVRKGIEANKKSTNQEKKDAKILNTDESNEER